MIFESYLICFLDGIPLEAAVLVPHDRILMMDSDDCNRW
jgi:hypothetical protein